MLSCFLFVFLIFSMLGREGGPCCVGPRICDMIRSEVFVWGLPVYYIFVFFFTCTLTAVPSRRDSTSYIIIVFKRICTGPKGKKARGGGGEAGVPRFPKIPYGCPPQGRRLSEMLGRRNRKICIWSAV